VADFHLAHLTEKFPGYAACGISGDPSPSEADMRLTRRILDASRILQINLLDHVIIGMPAPGRSRYFSFKEGGVIS
jgi:DNA repair protein RadC